MHIDTIVFDFGGVLIDWNPRHLYSKVFPDSNEMECFLAEICTDEWNAEQDRGRTLAAGTQYLVDQFPEKAELIRMYYGRWTEMLNGPIEGTVAILKELKKRYRVFGLTNWSAETFSIAKERYDFLSLMDGTVVSGIEKVIKPGSEIFQLLNDRYQVLPAGSVFIDDNLNNINAAKKLLYNTIHYKSPGQLHQELVNFGLL